VRRLWTLALGDDDIAAEGADGERGAAVAKGRADRPVARGGGGRCRSYPPMASGSSERIEPLKVLAVSSKPVDPEIVNRALPECVLKSNARCAPAFWSTRGCCSPT
jgi:hypothetical protein